MKISKTHQNFANCPGNARALSHPDEFLGPNWKEVLNFWIFIDTLSVKQLRIADSRYWFFDPAYRRGSRDLARKSAEHVDRPLVNCYAQLTSELILDRVLRFSPNLGAGYATWELIGVHKILEQGRSLTFVPLFLNL
jgi:hypothetical protein